MDARSEVGSRLRKDLSTRFETVVAQDSHVQEQLPQEQSIDLDALICEKHAEVEQHESTIVDVDCMQTCSRDDQESFPSGCARKYGLTSTFWKPPADQTQNKPLLSAVVEEFQGHPQRGDEDKMSPPVIEIWDEPSADLHELLQQHQTWMLQTWMLQQESMITRVVSRILSEQTSGRKLSSKGFVGTPYMSTCTSGSPRHMHQAATNSPKGGGIGPPYPLLDFPDWESRQSEAHCSQLDRDSKYSKVTQNTSTPSRAITIRSFPSFQVWKAQHKLRRESVTDKNDERRRNDAIMKAMLRQSISQSRETEAVQQPHRLTLQAIVDHQFFEMFFGFIILTNAIFVGVQVVRNAEEKYNSPAIAVPIDLYLVSFVYTVLFVLEFSMRIFAAGYRFFRLAESWFWNYLDVFIVPCTVFELVLDTLVLASGEKDSRAVTGNIKVFRMLRIVRLFRVVRITRLLRFCHELRVLVFSIMASSRALGWVFILLFGLLYMFGILFAQTVTDYYIEAQESGRGVQQWEQLSLFWGNLPRSMFTLYKSISGGLSWHDCVFPLHALGPHWIAVFVFFISVSYFSILNVVTGIFCQGAIERTQQDHDLMTEGLLANSVIFERQLQEMFHKLDLDDSGVLTIMEFEENIYRPDVQAFFNSLNVDTSDAWALFKLLDTDEGNEIDISEFVQGLMKLKGVVRRYDILQVEVWLKRISSKQSRIMDSILEIREQIKKILRKDGGTKTHVGTKPPLPGMRASL